MPTKSRGTLAEASGGKARNRLTRIATASRAGRVTTESSRRGEAPQFCTRQTGRCHYPAGSGVRALRRRATRLVLRAIDAEVGRVELDLEQLAIRRGIRATAKEAARRAHPRLGDHPLAVEVSE